MQMLQILLRLLMALGWLTILLLALVLVIPLLLLQLILPQPIPLRRQIQRLRRMQRTLPPSQR